MAKITINPISNNYSINVTNANYCTVALPITACWGPAFEDPNTTGKELETALEDTVWTRFNSTQAGLQSFVSAFRGPAANYRRAKDYSYQIALSLITNGYDVLVCRLCPGTNASGEFVEASTISYALLSSEPEDWATAYSNYFTKNGDTYAAVEGVPGTVAPAFAENTYYKHENDEYVLLTAEPADWAANYASYFTKTGEDTYAAVQGVPATVAPAFATDTYYEKVTVAGDKLNIKAKYPGTFGNNIVVTIKKVVTLGQTYWNAIVYAVDASNVRTSLENLTFVFDIGNSTDSILHISEIESQFITFSGYEGLTEASEIAGDETFGSDVPTIRLADGSDTAAQNSTDEVANILTQAQNYAKDRFALVSSAVDTLDYIKAIPNATTDLNVAYAIRFREWTFTYATKVFDLLKDKLSYNPNRIITPWDDQNFYELGATDPKLHFGTLSPMHVKLMDVAYNSRCATALLDIPKSLARDGVWNDSTSASNEGYVQKLCRYTP